MKKSAVVWLIAANVAVYALQFLTQGAIEVPLALWPWQPIDGQSYFDFWQIVTYAFLHSRSNFSHLLFNMLGLFMFGAEIERYVGPRRLLTCYSALLYLLAVYGQQHTVNPADAMSIEELQSFIRSEIVRWGEVVKQSGATVD